MIISDEKCRRIAEYTANELEWRRHEDEKEAKRKKALEKYEKEYESELTEEESSQIFEDYAKYLFGEGQDD